MSGEKGLKRFTKKKKVSPFHSSCLIENCAHTPDSAACAPVSSDYPVTKMCVAIFIQDSYRSLARKHVSAQMRFSTGG